MSLDPPEYRSVEGHIVTSNLRVAMALGRVPSSLVPIRSIDFVGECRNVSDIEKLMSGKSLERLVT